MDDNSSQTSVTDLPNKEAGPRNVQEDENTDQQYHNTTSQLHSQMSSDHSQKSFSCVCRFNGPLGDHLRSSMECVQQLQGDHLLQMKATGEIFIIKATLLLKGCPARGCPGGDHEQIPTQCLSWWRETGWKLLKWKGSGQNAESQVIKEKINQFRWNFTKRKKMRTSQKGSRDKTQNLSDTSQCNNQNITHHLCPICNEEGQLILHLHESKACLAGLVRLHLPNRAHIYRGKTRLAVFDLGIVCQLCPNPFCEGNLQEEGLTRHLAGACSQFYYAEGAHLFNWAQNQSATSLRDKIYTRKGTLRAFAANNRDVGSFLQDLTSVLRFTCSKCSIQGPLMDLDVHVIWGAGINDDGPWWECSQCRGTDDNHEGMVVNGVEKVKALGYCAEPGDTLKKILVNDATNQRQRVVLIPGFLLQDRQEDSQLEDEELNPNITTIIVPKNPDALNHISDEAAEKANQDKKSLEAVAEYFGRRHIYAPIAETLSVFYRLKMAEIRLERIRMLSNLSNTSKGKITSRDPNKADVKDRKPHFAQTQSFCLTNTCSWLQSWSILSLR